MINNKTVIISCAGIGKRLGRGVPKAIVEVYGEELILRTLKLLDDVEDVRIVVGYQAEKVIEKVLSYRRDVLFVFNHDYLNTGTGASVLLASKNAKKYILTIDGDVIIHPDDMKKLLLRDSEFVGVMDITTEDPVFVKVNSDEEAIGFSRENGEYEWTGITQLETKSLSETSGHTLTLVEPRLPLPIQKIRMREIDTENDFMIAYNWVKNGYKS